MIDQCFNLFLKKYEYAITDDKDYADIKLILADYKEDDSQPSYDEVCEEIINVYVKNNKGSEALNELKNNKDFKDFLITDIKKREARGESRKLQLKRFKIKNQIIKR